MALKKKRKPTSLSHGRQPVFSHRSLKPTSNAASAGAGASTSKATRTIIRTHHQLHKARAQAAAQGDTAKVAQLDAEIEQHGGLKRYQQASITGQSPARGGDSSVVLMGWLQELGVFATGTGTGTGIGTGTAAAAAATATTPTASNNTRRDTSPKPKPKPTQDIHKYNLLEIGALSPHNACSRHPRLAVERIDLHSQHPRIRTQDFMQRPLPSSDAERFDIVSLSLVLNYVPDPVGRGDMLKRTCEFLRRRGEGSDSHGDDDGNGAERSVGGREAILPVLFFVLPAPCVANSRYLTEALLGEMMDMLGYVQLRRKMTAKLIYSLWRYDGRQDGKASVPAVRKREVNPGAGRNNFAVVFA